MTGKINWFDKMMDDERIKKAERVKAKAKELTIEQYMELPIRERIKRSLSGDIKLKD